MEVVRGTVRTVLSIVMVLVLAIGIPGVWVWIASQVQRTTAPSFTAIAVFIAGIIVSYAIVALLIGWAKARSGELPGGRESFAWYRSMRDTPARPARTHRLENLLIVSVILVGIILTVWFFVAGDPGTPVGQ